MPAPKSAAVCWRCRARGRRPSMPARARGLNALSQAFIILCLPAIALGLYLKTGSPDMPAAPLAARLENPGNNIELLVAKVERHLAENPNDGSGWDVLAPIYFKMQRLGDAELAFRNAIPPAGHQPGAYERARRSADGQKRRHRHRRRALRLRRGAAPQCQGPAGALLSGAVARTGRQEAGGARRLPGARQGFPGRCAVAAAGAGAYRRQFRRGAGSRHAGPVQGSGWPDRRGRGGRRRHVGDRSQRDDPRHGRGAGCQVETGPEQFRRLDAPRSLLCDVERPGKGDRRAEVGAGRLPAPKRFRASN